MEDIVAKKMMEMQSSTSDFNPHLYEILTLIIQNLPPEQIDEIHMNLLTQINTNIQEKSSIDTFIGLLINISLFPLSDEKQYHLIFDYLQEQERDIFNGIVVY